MKNQKPEKRNAGPRWGYATLSFFDQIFPRFLGTFILKIGTWVALPLLPEARKSSRAYLALLFGRAPTWVEVWRHYFTFSSFLMDRLRMARGEVLPFAIDETSEQRLSSTCSAPALYGTFHVGYSDLMGFRLRDYKSDIHMIRLRVGNSGEMEKLQKSFQEDVKIIWINQKEELIFAIKDCLAQGKSLAMQCDRVEYASKVKTFSFLGKEMRFPFTIYHLAHIFKVPVIFCFAIKKKCDGKVHIFSSEVYTPTQDKEEAEVHFKGVLSLLQTLLQEHPYQWFNFEPLSIA